MAFYVYFGLLVLMLITNCWADADVGRQLGNRDQVWKSREKDRKSYSGSDDEFTPLLSRPKIYVKTVIAPFEMNTHAHIYTHTHTCTHTHTMHSARRRTHPHTQIYNIYKPCSYPATGWPIPTTYPTPDPIVKCPAYPKTLYSSNIYPYLKI